MERINIQISIECTDHDLSSSCICIHLLLFNRFMNEERLFSRAAGTAIGFSMVLIGFDFVCSTVIRFRKMAMAMKTDVEMEMGMGMGMGMGMVLKMVTMVGIGTKVGMGMEMGMAMGMGWRRAPLRVSQLGLGP